MTGIRARGMAPCDSGSVTTEVVLTMPLLLTFLFLVVFVGRLTDAKGDVVAAANDAARVASLQATLGEAAEQAQAAADATLQGEGIECVGGVDVTTSVPNGAFGRGAVVVTEVSCDVVTSDLMLLSFLGDNGVVTVRETAREPVDTHRSL